MFHRTTRAICARERAVKALPRGTGRRAARHRIHAPYGKWLGKSGACLAKSLFGVGDDWLEVPRRFSEGCHRECKGRGFGGLKSGTSVSVPRRIGQRPLLAGAQHLAGSIRREVSVSNEELGRESFQT